MFQAKGTQNPRRLPSEGSPGATRLRYRILPDPTALDLGHLTAHIPVDRPKFVAFGRVEPYLGATVRKKTPVPPEWLRS